MGERSNTRRSLAHAKVNPFLRVVGRRPDGYHDIETVVLPISLADVLEIHAFADPAQFRTLSLSLDVSGEPELVRRVPADETNLILRAAKALADRGGIRGFAEIRLEKRIPVAAGLGGGSADAAATLSALNDLWDLEVSQADLSAVASEVGSDVPAMLRGCSWARGRGEDVAGLETPSYRWALVTFDFGVSTADAYRWWDEDGSATGPEIPSPRDCLGGSPDETGPRLFNDLEPPVVRRYPAIGQAKELMLEGAAAGAVMSGSGPSVAGLLMDDRPLPAQIQHEIERMSGRPVGDVRSLASRPSA